jgi:hypothetical protein
MRMHSCLPTTWTAWWTWRGCYPKPGLIQVVLDGRSVKEGEICEIATTAAGAIIACHQFTSHSLL